jgi:hypothetical protein
MGNTLGRALIAAALCAAMPTLIFTLSHATLPMAILAGGLGMVILVVLALPEIKILLRL